MSWIPDRYRELRSLLRPERIEDEVDEELLHHIELRTADLVAAGMTPEQAREEALRRFGNVGAYRSETCEIEQSILKERRRMELMDAIRRETRFSLRGLVRAPVFTIVAVLTLGVGIGATTAIFSLLDSIVLKPLPYPAPDQLVQVNHAVPLVQEGQEWGNSTASYFYYGDEAGAFEELGAYTRTTFNVSGAEGAERIDGARASASLFRILGAEVVRGRMLSDADDQPGVDPVALISHEIWRTRYASDPSVVGRTITLNSTPVTVAGVLEPGFALPGWTPHFWLPRQLDRSAQPQNSHMEFITYGRLRDGATPEQAQTELETLKQRMTELFPTAYSQAFFDRSGFTPVVHPLRSMVLGTAGRDGRGIDSVLWVLLGAVSLVLLIACANVANLMLVRAESRRRELAVRAAMGAERAHMAVHYLAESVLLSVAATLLGLGLAWAGIRILIASAPATLPRLGEIGVSGTAVLFAVGLGVLTAVIFGMTPVLRSGTNFSELRESGRGSTPSRERQLVRSGLVVGQVGMALVLLAAGALMLRSFLNLQRVDAGIDPASVLTFTVTLPYPRYSDEQPIFNLQRELTQRVEALPGVELVSATSSLPLSGGTGCSITVGLGAQDTGSCVPVIFTLPGYFDALDIPVRGTAFGWQDVEQRRAQAVISRALAERMWPGEDPIGKQIISYQTEGAWFTIVGVADDVLADGLDQPPTQVVYYPTRRPAEEGFYGPHGIPTMRFVVETGLADPTTLTPAIRSILRDLDSEVPLADVRTMEEVMMASERMARTTFTMMLLGIAAVIALFLSAVGLYGVIAYLVGRRRAEIGVRMALGARVSQVARLVVLQSVRLALLGVVIGIAAAVPLMRFLSSLVWGVEPTDTLTLAAVSALLIGVAVAASAIPARRAALTPPSDALRAD